MNKHLKEVINNALPRRSKRISFNWFEAERIYEWKLALNQGNGSCCESCTEIEKKIAKFLGKRDARWLQTQVKRYPYFNRLQRFIGIFREENYYPCSNLLTSIKVAWLKSK